MRYFSPQKPLHHIQDPFVALLTPRGDRIIEVGFLYLCEGGGGGSSTGIPLARINAPARSRRRNPHPLVTERGGEPVNYRRIPQFEQWFIHPAALPSPPTSAFHCRQELNLSDRSSIKKRYFADQYAITAALAQLKCFPLRAGICRIIPEPLGSARTQVI